jgi:hypothetical protein
MNLKLIGTCGNGNVISLFPYNDCVKSHILLMGRTNDESFFIDRNSDKIVLAMALAD